MIDHVSLGVSDLQRSARFYAVVLEPLGYTLMVDHSSRVAFGVKYPELWLNARPGMSSVGEDTGVHICLRTRSQSAVDLFHSRALANGGWDDGAPGLRQATLVAYYAAFVRDPDGNRIEVMTVPADVSSAG